ncbi:39S ribosomal protein L9, mitochondrial-like isoform X2 [Portunus trituberculatus]|uniref:Large ribosomal subunit protein bL9m n=2 Tax=Portunus trituberculatus TaxID=210409 RepID=A0A5B7ETM8_PORTR|nr:39S ribosomal protein L9, mitochondrial-like isoform X2 [Portunus trituberculatus]MPC36439.1 39S ribosomal protein L9, mitochondrial [Portunus trituberculatus]
MLRSMVQGLACLRLHGAGPAECGALREAVQSSGAMARALPQPLVQPVRTTFILKRKKRPHLVKADKPLGSRKLKARHFLYDLVEDTNVRKKEPIRLILKTSVEGLGSRGEVVEVSPYKARKDLLLPGLAVYASPENLDKYSKLMVDTSQDDQPSSPFALSTAKLLSEMIINVSMNKTNPWVMEPWHVKVAFRKVGAMVPEEAITMPPHPIAGPDMALQGKAFVVKIKINNKEEAAVWCRVNHYPTDPLDRSSFQSHYWELLPDPIFPEQAALLEELFAMYQQRAAAKEKQ